MLSIFLHFVWKKCPLKSRVFLRPPLSYGWSHVWGINRKLYFKWAHNPVRKVLLRINIYYWYFNLIKSYYENTFKLQTYMSTNVHIWGGGRWEPDTFIYFGKFLFLRRMYWNNYNVAIRIKRPGEISRIKMFMPNI